MQLWTPVKPNMAYHVAADAFNLVTFKRTRTSAARTIVQIKPHWSGGISEVQMG